MEPIFKDKSYEEIKKIVESFKKTTWSCVNISPQTTLLIDGVPITHEGGLIIMVENPPLF